jgi:hypothetical protein
MSKACSKAKQASKAKLPALHERHTSSSPTLFVIGTDLKQLEQIMPSGITYVSRYPTMYS